MARLKPSTSVPQCLVFDASFVALTIAKITAKALGVSVERLPFRQLDVLDELGRLVRLRLGYQDLAEVQELAFREAELRGILDSPGIPPALPMYLQKEIINGSLEVRGTLRRALMLIQVSHWKVNQISKTNGIQYLFLERRNWMTAIKQYALGHDVRIIPVPRPIIIRSIIRSLLGPQIVNWLRGMRYRPAPQPQAPSNPDSVPGGSQQSRPVSTNKPVPIGNRKTGLGGKHKIVVPYYGHLNLDQPELYSDLFFTESPELSDEDLLVTFSIPRDPLDENKLSELQSRNIPSLVLHPGATTVPGMALYKPREQEYSGQSNLTRVPKHIKDSSWLNNKIKNYGALRDYWSALFSENNVKAFVTWYKYDGSHFPIADAIQGLGGIMAVYQRSHETHPLADGTTYADVVFGFSADTADVERASKSVIRYYVTTGYMGDHRFALLQNNATKMRDDLRSHGAEHILAFFDENSGDDIRWHTGHEFMQQNYAFILDKLLEEPNLGVIFKPKSPGTLRKRLGPVAEILKQAEATGRCYVYEGGAMHGSHSPAEAALAADIAIHGHICAATAGLEASFAGVPTLLLDREGWPVSPLYELGKGTVVFTEWQQMWDACKAHWSKPGSIDGFGDWSSMIDSLDPFRDGRSAERMGTYLNWLLEGFNSGLDRETVMADAAERYGKAWGYDKVTEINGLPSWKNRQPTLN